MGKVNMTISTDYVNKKILIVVKNIQIYLNEFWQCAYSISLKLLDAVTEIEEQKSQYTK